MDGFFDIDVDDANFEIINKHVQVKMKKNTFTSQKNELMMASKDEPLLKRKKN